MIAPLENLGRWYPASPLSLSLIALASLRDRICFVAARGWLRSFGSAQTIKGGIPKMAHFAALCHWIHWLITR